MSETFIEKKELYSYNVIYVHEESLKKTTVPRDVSIKIYQVVSVTQHTRILTVPRYFQVECFLEFIYI